MSPDYVAQLLISLGSLASVLLAGRRHADRTPKYPFAPWLLLFAAHAVFLGYALLSGQPFFLPLNVGMMTAAAINARISWRAARPRPSVRS